MIGTALLNRNLHEQHQRKLSEIRQSRSKLFNREEGNPLLATSGGHKGHYLKKLHQLNIHHENVNLADRFRNIFSRKSQFSVKNDHHENILMQNRSRSNFHERVASENYGMLRRIISQKSQYRFQPQQEKPSVLRQSLMRVRNRSKTLTDNRSEAEQRRGFEVVPFQSDDFNHRKQLVHTGITILNKLCMLEISNTERFYYLTLDFVTMALKYKLRLSKEAGERTLEMYRNNPEQFHRKRIVLERNRIYLVIIWGAFIRKYPFKRLLQTSQSQSKHMRTVDVGDTQSQFFRREKDSYVQLNDTIVNNMPQLKDTHEDVYDVFRRVGNPTPSSRLSYNNEEQKQ